MRYSIGIILLMLFVSSCSVMHVPETHSKTDPYVELKDGQKFTGTSAERKGNLFTKDRIILGDTSFPSKNVAFYSTGGENYANVGRKVFAQQVAAGKINVYKYETTSYSSGSYGGGSYGHGGYSKHISYYVQHKDGDPVKTFKYKNIAPMIEPRTPEFAVLQKYRKTRTISRIFGYSSLGLMAAGVAMANSNSTGTQNIGTAVAAVGLSAAITWMFTNLPKQHLLLKTVLTADKESKRAHKKVR